MEFAPLEKKPVKRFEPPVVPKALPPQTSEAEMYRGYGANYGKGFAFLEPNAKLNKPTPAPSTVPAAPLWIKPGSEALNYRGYGGGEYGKGFAFLDPYAKAKPDAEQMPEASAPPSETLLAFRAAPVPAEAPVAPPPVRVQPGTGAPAGRPGMSPTYTRPITPVPEQIPDTFIQNSLAHQKSIQNLKTTFGNRLPSSALGMPPGFLETINGQWNSVTEHKTFTATGSQVADPNYPPTAQQTLQVWNVAWASWKKDPAQLPPEGQKAYARDYQNYLQVQKTLQEQAAAEAWAGQALKSLSPKTSKATQPKAKAKPSTPTPPPKQSTAGQIQQNVADLKARQNQEADDLLSRQDREHQDAQTQRQHRDAADGAKDARQKLDQEDQKRTNQANYDATINSISQTTDAKINAMYRTFHEIKLTTSLEGVPPEQQQQVMQQAAQLYRQKNNGKPYNLSNPKDPENNPLMLSQMVDQVRGQGGAANVPVVTKPDGLPKPSQKQGDKTLPTLPIQPKKPDGQQGSFLPKPLPDVKPKSEGEPAKDDPSQAHPVTSKASDPSEVEPPTAKQDGATGKQKRSKLTASGVKKAVAATQKWGTDYRANYKKANGSIPAGHQIHHITPRAVFRDNPLAQEWTRRGITKLDYPENLQALPQSKDAYGKSDIKIQHSGSHDIWSTHATEVLEAEQRRLVKQYGSLDKVPDDVMKRTKDDVMQGLREDLLDKDFGLEKGWVVPKDSGMDKLSQSQFSDQIG
jgi:A nuclease family of the HNH/ENDO VII superfamily with conserved AHH